MTDDKRPGRPRQYETSSEKLSAFRQRQESAGYLRKEVLVTKETTERLAGLAKQHSVSALDVASALLEHGLMHYESEQVFGSLPLRSNQQLHQSYFGSVSGSMRSAPVAAALSAPLLSDDVTFAQAADPGNKVDPIQQFFARRKESRNEK